jgi:hypothetical protein
MKRNAAIALILAALVLMSACSARKSAPSEAYAYDAPMEMAPAAMEESGVAFSTSQSMNSSAAAAPAEELETAGSQKDIDVRKIIYNADLELTSDDPAAAAARIAEKAKALGGYLADSYTTNDELGAYRSTATLKVPADRIEELVTAAGAEGKVDHYQLSSEDISLSYYDIEARLKSAKAEEEQLTGILKTCTTVEEVLAVRESLAEVRSDIESYQGQINLWDNLVSYATLQLTVRRTARAAVEGEAEPIAIWKASDVFKKMSLGFTNSARFVVNAVGAIGIFLAYAILPAAAVLAIVYGVILIRRRTAPARAARREERLKKRALREEARRAKKANQKNE